MLNDLASLRNELETLQTTIDCFQMACDRFGEAHLTVQELKGLQFIYTSMPKVNWEAIESEIEQQQEEQKLEAENLQRQDRADYWQSTAGSLATSNGHLHY